MASQTEFERRYDAAVRAEIKRRSASAVGQRCNSSEAAIQDRQYWAAIPYLTIDEATALSLDKNPRVVTWELVRSYVKADPFCAEYEARRELISRAIEVGQLPAKPPPVVFAKWAAPRFHLSDELRLVIERTARASRTQGRKTGKQGRRRGSATSTRYADVSNRTWDKLTLEFVTPLQVRAKLGSRNDLWTYQEMELCDQRCKARPTNAWHVLAIIAANDGSAQISEIKGRNIKSPEAEVKTLRDKLQKFFGMSENPIPNVPGVGYRPRFMLLPSEAMRHERALRGRRSPGRGRSNAARDEEDEDITEAMGNPYA